MNDDTPHDNREYERKKKLLENAANDLLDSGAFNGLVILASWEMEDGATAAVQATRGNWYAQNGLADHFLTKRRENGREEMRQQMTNQDKSE